MDLNLDTLKREILDYLGASEFAVFRSHSGALDALPIITWDSETFPDYRMFLDTARKAGQKLILFGSRALEEDEVDEAEETLRDVEPEPDEARDYEKRFREARRHIGATCSIEMAFDHNSHLYVYELRPDWYEEFVDGVEEMSAPFGIEDDDLEGDEHDGLGGYYSNN